MALTRRTGLSGVTLLLLVARLHGQQACESGRVLMGDASSGGALARDLHPPYWQPALQPFIDILATSPLVLWTCWSLRATISCQLHFKGHEEPRRLCQTATDGPVRLGMRTSQKFVSCRTCPDRTKPFRKASTASELFTCPIETEDGDELPGYRLILMNVRIICKRTIPVEDLRFTTDCDARS